MKPALLGLAASAGVSGLGTGITQLALPWFVLATTGRGTDTGIVMLAQTAGIFAATAFAGPWIDRLRPRRCAVLFDLLGCVVVGAVPVLHAQGALGLPLLFALALLLGLTRGPAASARMVLVPHVAAATGTPIERVTTSHDAPQQGGQALGAPIAGAIIAVAGAPVALYVDAASFLVSAVVTWCTVPEAFTAPAPEPYLRRLAGGVRFLGHDRLLRALIIAVLLLNMIGAGFGSVLLPAYGQRVLHSATASGVILAACGVAMIAGSVLYSMFGPGRRRWPVLVASYLILFGPRIIVFLFPLPLWVLVLVCTLTTVAFGPLNPIYDAVKAERVPPQLRARVFGAIAAAALAGMPIGEGLAGVSLDVFGLLPTLGVFACSATMISLSPLVFGVWRQVDRRPAAATVGA